MANSSLCAVVQNTRTDEFSVSSQAPEPTTVGFYDIVRQFTPNWFTVTMGTGVLGLALDQFPVAIPGLHQIGAVLWLSNIGLFTLFSVLYAARWIFFFEEAKRIFQPNQNVRPITLTLSNRHLEMMVRDPSPQRGGIQRRPKGRSDCAADFRRGSGTSRGRLACMGRLGESARMIAIT